MAFSNGQIVQAADLNNFSVTSVTTTGNVTVGADLAVTDDVTVGGDLTVTGAFSAAGRSENVCCGRLTLTSGTPVTTADVTAATSLFWALYGGNTVALYTGTAWTPMTLAELSIAVPATTNQMYDVFIDYNAGTPVLALTAWTNDTTRATALTKQDGRLVLTGTTTKLYVGSFRTTGVSGQTEDSFAKRFVWNYYNRMPREMRVTEATNSWSYGTATWRQANGAATNQLEFVIGVAEVSLYAEVRALSLASTSAVSVAVAVGLDSTTAPTTGNIGMGSSSNDVLRLPLGASLRAYPAVGYHFAAWLEINIDAIAVTWLGDNNAPTLYQSGISGRIDG